MDEPSKSAMSGINKCQWPFSPEKLRGWRFFSSLTVGGLLVTNTDVFLIHQTNNNNICTERNNHHCFISLWWWWSQSLCVCEPKKHQHGRHQLNSTQSTETFVWVCFGAAIHPCIIMLAFLLVEVVGGEGTHFAQISSIIAFFPLYIYSTPTSSSQDSILNNAAICSKETKEKK